MQIAVPRRRRPLLCWLLLAPALWLGQLLALHLAFADGFAWGRYWRLRALYRPGIAAAQALDATLGGPLPGWVFDPLSPTGAKVAFALAAAVYGLGVAAAAWLVRRSFFGR